MKNIKFIYIDIFGFGAFYKLLIDDAPHQDATGVMETNGIYNIMIMGIQKDFSIKDLSLAKYACIQKFFDALRKDSEGYERN